MVYPRLKPELDRRKKLMPNDIENIRSRYKMGESEKRIASDYGVATPTIHYWTDDEYRKRCNLRSSKESSRRYREDPTKWKEMVRESGQYVRSVNPAVRLYNNEKNREKYFMKTKESNLLRTAFEEKRKKVEESELVDLSRIMIRYARFKKFINNNESVALKRNGALLLLSALHREGAKLILYLSTLQLQDAKEKKNEI